MSKIGKKPIKIVTNTKIEVDQNCNQIKIEGKHGSLSKTFLKIVSFKIESNELIVSLNESTKFGRSYYGLVRNLIQNMVTGVSTQFSKSLIAEGVGYKFQVDNGFLILNIGFTHPIKLEIPKELAVKLVSSTKILITGISKEYVGLYASKIRAFRPPEPYKGKGIMYENEIIRRKAGKTGR
jgi:large subunit ribosomal protein L6|uniref:Ribosomal protein L6 n=1 Tax=Poterioochromonas malhamensis TaxID=88167 RepID=A0A7T7BW96_9STRA|nr:ribosomal protein L6 [Poterioochromonas malhamensis]QQK54990.1 ribosomal protein L6 [Poterioochromonas malhamensis]|eukprot:gene23974-gene18853